MILDISENGELSLKYSWCVECIADDDHKKAYAHNQAEAG